MNRRTANKKTDKIVLPTTKALTKTTNCTCRAKKVEGHDKKLFLVLWSDVCFYPPPTFKFVLLSLSLFRLQYDLYCVGWGVKLYSLTHCHFPVGKNTINSPSFHLDRRPTLPSVFQADTNINSNPKPVYSADRANVVLTHISSSNSWLIGQ